MKKTLKKTHIGEEKEKKCCGIRFESQNYITAKYRTQSDG